MKAREKRKGKKKERKKRKRKKKKKDSLARGVVERTKRLSSAR
jgi:hypothetical protein